MIYNKKDIDIEKPYFTLIRMRINIFDWTDIFPIYFRWFSIEFFRVVLSFAW